MLNELREAVRGIVSRPGVSIVVLLTLALAIGINTTLFSALNAVLLRPLPYPGSERLVMVWERHPAQGRNQEPASAATYVDWRARAKTFSALGAYRYRGMTLTARDEPVRVSTVDVSPALFRVLGVPPRLGRVFTQDEETPGHERLMVLSHRAWVNRFDSRNIIGTSIQLDGQAYTVVGVMPDGFVFPAGDEEVEIWTPLTIGPDAAQARGHRSYPVIGRLAGDTTIDQARREMELIAEGIARENPAANAGWTVALVPALDQLTGSVRSLLWFLFGAVTLVLGIGCVNVANILLAESTRSSRDYAVRAALGGSRWALLRRSLLESLVLALMGGLAGLVLAAGGIRMLRAVMPGNIPRLAGADIDLRVLGFTLLVSVACGIAFGLIPALRATRPDIVAVLRDGSGGAGAISRRTRGLGNLLVAAEVALAVVLLTGAGLLLRSFAELSNVNPGFRRQGVIDAAIALPQSRYPNGAAQRQFFLALAERVKRLPGVRAAGAVSTLPLSAVGMQFQIPFTVEGLETRSPTERPTAEYRAIIPGYFEAMGMALIRGRFLEERDLQAGPTRAVINQTLARRYFPDVDPVGRPLRAMPMVGDLEIVGVVNDVRHSGLQAEFKPEVFVPFSRLPLSQMHLVVYSTEPAATIVSALRAEVLSLDPQLPLASVSTVEDLIAASIAQPRFNMTLLLGLAVTAILLAGVGIYGVVSYVVARRTGEMGLRLALGADPGDVTRLVLFDVLRVVGSGLVAGVVGAVLLSRAAASMFFGVSPTDPVTYVAVAAAVLTVALLAASRPALRARRIDPAVALRTV